MAAAAPAGEPASRETKAVVGAALLALRASQQEVSEVAARFQQQLPTHAAKRVVNAAYPELQARLDAASAAVTGVFQYMSTQGLRGFTYELCEEEPRPAVDKPAAPP